MTAGAASRKGKAAAKSYFLSEAERDYFDQNFETEAGCGVEASTVALDKWLPWQSSLQPHHSVGHSTLSRNFVDVIQLIQVDGFNRIKLDCT